MRRLATFLWLTTASCAALQMERRLAPADQKYQVGKVVVVPFSVSYHACPDDIDRKARTEAVTASVSATAEKALQRRGYAVQPLQADPGDPALKAYHKALDHLLCSGGPRGTLPPEVLDFAKAAGERAQATSVLIGGVSRLRWHLKLDTEQENGLVGNGSGSMSQFTVGAAAALLDLASGRVVWTETVDNTLLATSYADTIEQLFLFAQLRTTDPHDRLYYDFPPFIGAAPIPAESLPPKVNQ